MAKRKLSEKQHAAIALLTEIGTDALSYEEIAERIDVSTSTLRRWRTENDDFVNEVISQTRRNAIKELPRVMAAIPDIIVDDKNAAMFRTWLQAIGALTEKVEVETSVSGAIDVEAIRARMAEFKGEPSED